MTKANKPLPLRDLKEEERRIVGTLLIEFFEIEKDLNQVLAARLLAPYDTDALETLLDNTPLRHRINAARDFDVLEESEAKIFQSLCDQRNRLAHGPSKGKTIMQMFPASEQARFVAQCKILREAMTRAMDEILENL